MQKGPLSLKKQEVRTASEMDTQEGREDNVVHTYKPYHYTGVWFTTHCDAAARLFV